MADKVLAALLLAVFLTTTFSTSFSTTTGSGSDLEHYFIASNVASTATEQGCVITRWTGGDPAGIIAPPAFASIVCPTGSAWTTTGWPSQAISLYCWDGSIDVNGTLISTMSSFIWLQLGASVTITIHGKAIALGGDFNFTAPPGPQFTSSYNAPLMRVYDVADAVANKNSATLAHDPHQRNGDADSNCFDFVYSSTTRVDPPAVTVLACNSSGSWVPDHFHPWGATYIPFSGSACFNTPKQHCVDPGNARWTSPLLRYSESFTPPTETPSKSALAVVSAAGFGTKLPACPAPIIMGVTNFDPAHDPEGVPNFVDIPDPTRPMFVVRPPTIRVEGLAWPRRGRNASGEEL